MSMPNFGHTAVAADTHFSRKRRKELAMEKKMALGAIVIFFGIVGLTFWKLRPAEPVVVERKEGKAGLKKDEAPPAPKKSFTDPVRGLSGKIRAKELAKVAAGNFEVNLTELYFTEEELSRMAEIDFFARGKAEVSSDEYKTSAGVFRHVTCFGRYSINASAKYAVGTERYDALKLPNGKWAKLKLGSGLLGIVEKDDTVFLICQSHIFKYTKECKLECVMVAGASDEWSISTARESRDYLWVQKPNSHDFGGLLLCRDGEWIFHQYKGQYACCLNRVEAKDGVLTLYLLDGWDKEGMNVLLPRIEFNQKTGVFTDL